MDDHAPTVVAVMSDIVIPAIAQLPPSADIEVLALRKERRLRALDDETITVTEFELTLQSHGDDFHDIAYADIVGARMDTDDWIERLVSNLHDFLARTGVAWDEVPKPRGPG